MKAKYVVVTVITTLLLLVPGFLFLPTLLVQLTKSIIENDLMTLNPGESINFAWANAFLLASCAPVALVVLWAYSRKRPGWPRIYGFLLCLPVTIASAATGIVLRLLVVAKQLRSIGELGRTTGIAISNLGYSRWGFGTLVVVCGTLTIFLLLLSQQRTVGGSDDGEK
jgi:hypothetical protein